MIEDIKDLLKIIESSDSKSEKIRYSLEVCRVVFKNIVLDEKDYKNLESDDLIVESISEMHEIVKYSSSFLEHSLKYLEADIKDDFGVEVQENSKLLQDLHGKFEILTKQYKKLNGTKQKVEKVEFEIDELQDKIDEFAQVDLEKIHLQKEQMIQKLEELEKTEGDNLKIYKKHLEENRKLNIFSNELFELSDHVKNDLSKMDEKLKGIRNG